MDLTAVDPIWWVVLAALVLLAIGIVVWSRQRSARKRSDRLRKRFRTEYDRTAGSGNRRAAEADLERRLARRREIDLADLGEGDTEELRGHIDEILHGFVDGPEGTARGMTQLVGQVAVARGYVATEEGVLDLVSVDHPQQVASLRHGLSDMEQAKDPERTEMCRRVCLDARELAERLLGEGRAGQLDDHEQAAHRDHREGDVRSRDPEQPPGQP
jgi:hypothetical protein